MLKHNIRQRPLDFEKPVTLVANIAEVISQDCFDMFTTKMIEINRMTDLYDSRKTIVIPKVQIFQNPKEETSMNTMTLNHYSQIEYSQKEYQRPSHYILYTQEQRNKTKSIEYEATITDIDYLKSDNINISAEDFENMIIAIENDISQYDPILLEKAFAIIFKFHSDNTTYIVKLSNYFELKRNNNKKSLLRKYWRKTKTTDNYVLSTFNPRNQERRKNRRMKFYQEEILSEITKIKTINEDTLKTIINTMTIKEEWRMHLLNLNHYIFLQEYKRAERNYPIICPSEEELIKYINQLGKIPYEDNNPKKKDTINEIIIEPIDKAETDNSSYVKTRKVRDNTINSKTTKRNRKHFKQITKQSQPIIKIKKLKPSSVKQIQNIITEPKCLTEKQIPLSPEESSVKFRVRFNRSHQMVIDRYIQQENSFSPFDDSITQIVNHLSEINPRYCYHTYQSADFNLFYNQYLKEEVITNEVLSDSEDNDALLKDNLKIFQNNHQEFLKQKRYR